MNIAILDKMSEDSELETDLVANTEFGLVMLDQIDPNQKWIEQVKHCQGIITERVFLDAALMDRLRACKVIVRMGIGVDNIDLHAATERGIYVLNVPDYCTEEVADHTLSLLMCVARRILPYNQSVKERNWAFRLPHPIHRISDQTIGVLGLGKTAKAFIERVIPLGCRIMVWTPHPEKHSDFIESKNIIVANENELLAHSDYIVILLPLVEQTYHYICREKLRKMKRNAWIINTSRGHLIRESDLIEALGEGWISGAALDVLSQEPPDWSNPLLQMENVILTPHAAFYSERSLLELRRKSVICAMDVLRGNEPVSLVNKEVINIHKRT